MPSNIRVYELARELGLTNAETLDLSEGLGIGVKSHSSSIVDAQADRVRRKAEREGLIRDEQPPEPEKPKKAAKKSTKKAAKKSAKKTAKKSTKTVAKTATDDVEASDLVEEPVEAASVEVEPVAEAPVVEADPEPVAEAPVDEVSVPEPEPEAPAPAPAAPARVILRAAAVLLRSDRLKKRPFRLLRLLRWSRRSSRRSSRRLSRRLRSTRM